MRVMEMRKSVSLKSYATFQPSLPYFRRSCMRTNPYEILCVTRVKQHSTCTHQRHGAGPTPAPHSTAPAPHRIAHACMYVRMCVHASVWSSPARARTSSTERAAPAPQRGRSPAHTPAAGTPGAGTQTGLPR